MAKRFTDSEKWKKQFFRKLKPAYKCFWIFITDECSHSGIWNVDDPTVIESRIGEKIDLDTALYAFNEDEKRVLVINGGKQWFIMPFITFQYGDLNPKNRLHESVRRELESKNLGASIPVRGPLEAPKDKDLDKELVKERDTGEVDPKFNQLEAFEKFWVIYPLKGRLKRSASLRLWCEIAVNRDFASRLQKSAKNYAEHLKANEWKQPQDCPNWLENWHEWESFVEVKAKREVKPGPDCTACGGSGKLPDGKKCWCWS